MGNYTILQMFENPRRGRQARNFTTNVPKLHSRTSNRLLNRYFPKIDSGCPCLYNTRLSSRLSRNLEQIMEFLTLGYGVLKSGMIRSDDIKLLSLTPFKKKLIKSQFLLTNINCTFINTTFFLAFLRLIWHTQLSFAAFLFIFFFTTFSPFFVCVFCAALCGVWYLTLNTVNAIIY